MYATEAASQMPVKSETFRLSTKTIDVCGPIQLCSFFSFFISVKGSMAKEKWSSNINF